jgi:hypothetical protein
VVAEEIDEKEENLVECSNVFSSFALLGSFFFFFFFVWFGLGAR